MIQVTKLITGEELIGDVTIDDRVTIKNPCVLQMVPMRSNPEQVGMALAPVAMHIEDHSITVKQEHVVWMNSPVKELYNQYNSAFGSGIQLATL
jgi:hypothetical protein